MTLLSKADWPDIERIREEISRPGASTVQAAAQTFATVMCESFSSVALTRVFVVVPFAELPPRERRFAARIAQGDPRLKEATPALTLLGTRGREPLWNDRTLSSGHLCIPLLDKTFVESAPMIAKLLADIDVDLAAFDDGRPIVTRRLLGGKNGMFYIPDAATAIDDLGRNIIPDRSFVTKYDIHTVFGMGGAYLDGTLIIAIVFSTESMDRLLVDRFPSLIANLKMNTAHLVARRRIFSG